MATISRRTFASLAGLGAASLALGAATSACLHLSLTCRAEAAHIGYEDGTYTATVQGYESPIEVSVTIKDWKLQEINASAKEPSIGMQAIDMLIPKIIENDSTDGIDVVSGATETSRALLSAVYTCLKRAKDEAGRTKYVERPKPEIKEVAFGEPFGADGIEVTIIDSWTADEVFPPQVDFSRAHWNGIADEYGFQFVVFYGSMRNATDRSVNLFDKFGIQSVTFTSHGQTYNQVSGEEVAELVVTEGGQNLTYGTGAVIPSLGSSEFYIVYRVSDDLVEGWTHTKAFLYIPGADGGTQYRLEWGI